MFKKIFMIAAIAGLSTPAFADTFQQRLENPHAGAPNFVCQTMPDIHISYYTNPNNGKTWVKFWQEMPDGSGGMFWNDIEVEFPGTPRTGQIRRKCGFSPQELQWMRMRNNQSTSGNMATIGSSVRTARPRTSTVGPVTAGPARRQ